MLFKLFCVVVIINICGGDEADVDYVDSVINMLLNGKEVGQLDEVDDDVEPTLSGGIWKCGNCDELGENKIVYTEVNEAENLLTDASLDIQIGFNLPGMQCVTVQSNTAGVVRRVSGSCTSGALTLSITPAAQFTVHIYK